MKAAGPGARRPRSGDTAGAAGAPNPGPHDGDVSERDPLRNANWAIGRVREKMCEPERRVAEVAFSC
jgi:hypothetical protein